MLFDANGNPMTPSHAVKQGTRYRYYVSRPLIIKDQTKGSAGLRIPAGEIEHLVTSRVRQWLLHPGGIYSATRLVDASAQRWLVARATELGNSWPGLPATRQRALLTTLIERIDVGTNRIDIQIRPTGLGALLDPAAALPPNATGGETQTLSVLVKLRRCGREIRMLVGTDPFATAKPDRRLINLLIRARRFNAALAGSDGVPFAALAKQEGVSPSYFTRLVRLSYLAPDITLCVRNASRRIPQKGVRIRQSLACAVLRREWWAWRRPVRSVSDPRGRAAREPAGADRAPSCSPSSGWCASNWILPAPGCVSRRPSDR